MRSRSPCAARGTVTGGSTHDRDRERYRHERRPTAIDYTTGALHGVARTLADGLDVRGYLHWTFIDNFEWVHGYAITFGLVAVDRTTFERTPKGSASWLGRVAETNGAQLS